MKQTLAISMLFCSLMTAQEPPILIKMIREQSREEAFRMAGIYERSGLATPVFATTPTTGAAETIFFEIHESYASIEATDTVTNLGKLTDRAAPYSTVLVLIPGLSFRPDLAAKLLPRARYFQVSTYRIRPGSAAEFGELMRLRRAAFEAVNPDRPEMAYQVVSGATSGTYVMIAPLTSLKNLDNGSIRNPAYAIARGIQGQT